MQYPIQKVQEPNKKAQESNQQRCEFVPITDEALDQNPTLLLNLVPYSRNYRCHRELADTSAVKVNRRIAVDNAATQLPLFIERAK